MTSGRRTAASRLLLVAGLAVSALGCQQVSEPTITGSPATAATARSASRPSAPPSTPTTLAAAAEVLAAYARFWEVYVQAAASAHPDHPALEDVATGRALDGLRLQLTVDRREGIVARGRPVRSATRITRLTAQHAELSECLDSNQWLAHDRDTGELRDAPSGIIRQVGAALTRTPTGWKVAELDIGETACGG